MNDDAVHKEDSDGYHKRKKQKADRLSIVAI
jgi:hypothetical protein